MYRTADNVSDACRRYVVMLSFDMIDCDLTGGLCVCGGDVLDGRCGWR